MHLSVQLMGEEITRKAALSMLGSEPHPGVPRMPVPGPPGAERHEPAVQATVVLETLCKGTGFTGAFWDRTFLLPVEGGRGNELGSDGRVRGQRRFLGGPVPHTPRPGTG
ncbi:hypothetical protein KIL84_008534 [Mauremys mutica]|uniref:Uncharacterized protein n=1 Tax=Mauremys mutica TaxID=74926 RepID=A0A9D3X7V9_9SAUR|nr:hypothetical protein KIL84_008534 [Mauremys mutica]